MDKPSITSRNIFYSLHPRRHQIPARSAFSEIKFDHIFYECNLPGEHDSQCCFSSRQFSFYAPLTTICYVARTELHVFRVELWKAIDNVILREESNGSKARITFLTFMSVTAAVRRYQFRGTREFVVVIRSTRLLTEWRNRLELPPSLERKKSSKDRFRVFCCASRT